MVDILEALAAAPGPLSTAEIATELGVHRSIVYRAVQTLAHRRLVRRETDGRYTLGIGLVLMANSVARDFQELVQAELAALADRSSSSVMFAVDSDGQTESLLTAEPRNAEVHLSLRVRGLSGHHVGSDSVAALAMRLGRPAEPGEPAAVRKARKRGYLEGPSTRWPGISLRSAPVLTAPGYANASVTVLYATGAAQIDPEDLLRTASILSEYFVQARVSLPFPAGPDSASATGIG